MSPQQFFRLMGSRPVERLFVVMWAAFGSSIADRFWHPIWYEIWYGRSGPIFGAGSGTRSKTESGNGSHTRSFTESNTESYVRSHTGSGDEFNTTPRGPGSTDPGTYGPKNLVRALGQDLKDIWFHIDCIIWEKILHQIGHQICHQVWYQRWYKHSY